MTEKMDVLLIQNDDDNLVKRIRINGQDIAVETANAVPFKGGMAVSMTLTNVRVDCVFASVADAPAAAGNAAQAKGDPATAAAKASDAKA